VYEYESVVVAAAPVVNITLPDAATPVSVVLANVPALKSVSVVCVVDAVVVESVSALAPVIMFVAEAYCVELVAGATSPTPVAPPLQLLCENVYVAAFAIFRLFVKRMTIEKIATATDVIFCIRRCLFIVFP
jgi:hypothetical protein